MSFFKSFDKKLDNIQNYHFEDLAIELFQFQATHNDVYASYLNGLQTDASKVKTIEQIPFLPIRFFKSREVVCGEWVPEKVFRSSGTTGMQTSKHNVKDILRYQRHSKRIFDLLYGDVTNYHILALLPSYLERDNSSLVSMCQYFIEQSEKEYSGFYLNDVEALYEHLQHLKHKGENVLLIGVTFALLDFVEKYKLHFPDLIVMETGGMKGRRKEMIREEVHDVLRQGFGVPHIHSEYGMTELLSQAYAKKAGEYVCPPWMKVYIRDINDPFDKAGQKAGLLQVVDLANIHSCAFIETEDLGRKNENDSFDVIGRMDNSEMRGCSLMVV